jgi:hypothetical protein
MADSAAEAEAKAEAEAEAEEEPSELAPPDPESDSDPDPTDAEDSAAVGVASDPVDADTEGTLTGLPLMGTSSSVVSVIFRRAARGVVTGVGVGRTDGVVALMSVSAEG